MAYTGLSVNGNYSISSKFFCTQRMNNRTLLSTATLPYIIFINDTTLKLTAVIQN